MAIRELPITGGKPANLLGRVCVAFPDTSFVVEAIANVGMSQGTIELDLAVTGERSFPGIAWRLDGTTYESFFVRPHQMGNPDAIQYTPVFNDVSAWQLYHGDGFWAPTQFPLNEWFTIRVAFAGQRGEAFVADPGMPALVFDRLRVPVESGSIGILPGGAGVHFARLAYDDAPPHFAGAAPAPPVRDELSVSTWSVSNPVAEGSPPSTANGWQLLESEPSGLANLARLHPVTDELNTVFARATLHAEHAGVREMDLGFSDRAVVHLNGHPLFRGDDTYRSRDYRFLGSIGYYVTLYLPLNEGDNELIVAVSESCGGWGLQARFHDLSGLVVE
jgi:hypothetical protein